MDFSYILNKKARIQEKINSINKTMDIGEYWIHDNFENSSNCIFAGGDGSFNKIDYIDYCLYSVGTISYINETGGKIEESIKQWDIDIMLPYKYVSNRLRLYMINMELKTILWNFINKDIDYYLFDGSLYSLLIQTHTYGAPRNLEQNSDLTYCYNSHKKELMEKIYAQLNNNDLSPIYDYNEDEKILFEQLEYIVLLVEILKNYKNKIIGISKTSKMSIYFENSNMPDMGIFSKGVKKTGYSKPINLVEKQFNEGINYTINNFKKLYPLENLYYGFLKLDNNSGLTNITSFCKLDNEVFSNLKEISVSGYPYVLKKSHETVKISNKSMELCGKLLGINKKRDRDIILD
ncbi:DNA double-strand break repair nuclease NurA [Methanococcus aeolicus]|uniref:NurA domain-containing protein n=1 Tax=Methanococcus aeolicus (strain ATCC BAA-1280 / DSM 17508 / OCM 812 / Nankai-3) TaxID=419665 RepID=A6USY9_META3|nr:DNA double-strand break repair nuclease NurA [Methanococcus aeolicus]ABR55611.1 conserved hypothetical protein [Methanococcus aeolicus Nankai-3]UXM85109.1 DNA double-strand break repair nuclease NurA [Methanococcus aeolicus]